MGSTDKPTAIGWGAPEPDGETRSDSPPERPSALHDEERLGDRYVVRQLIGRGGMGAVYRAHDEKLGEDVALKVVGSSLVDKLRDEVRLAQKVAHPSVCRTYDLEEIDGRFFIKMEFVAGETLAARLVREKQMPIDEAVRIARAVAAGLGAAHEQGIVHRDLKPANVMLSGDRVVLMDFGIAKLVAGQSMHTMAGTFGYMAPEQFSNVRVGPRADLYALGCLLYEMLAGELVFGAANPIELAARHVALAAPDVREKRPDVPRWLARAIAGLLAKDPNARGVGLERLAAGPRSWKSVALPVGAFALAVAGATALVVSSTGSRPEPCRGTEARLAGVWDAPAKQKVSTAFAAIKKPYATRAHAGVEHALDGYAQQWTAAVTESCRATRVRGDQTDEVMALREMCFERRLAELRALVQILGDADEELVAKGDETVAGLEPITSCANIAALRAPDAPPTEPKEKVAAVEQALAEADAQTVAGHQLAALNAAKRAEKLADELHYSPYKAKALVVEGRMLGIANNVEASADACREGAMQAIAGRRDDVATDAAMCAANMTSGRSLPEARVWIRLARTLGARFGLDAQREARLLDAEALLAGIGGDTATALAMQEKAIAVAERALGPTNITIAVQHESLAETLAKNGAYDKALPHFEHALQILEGTLGTEHPVATAILINLGACYSHVGQAQKARVTYDRALEIIEHTEGKASPNLVMALNNMADAATKAHDPNGALLYLDRAKGVAATTLGDANPLSHAVLVTRAEALAAAGRLADAREQYDQAIALETKYQSPYLAQSLASRGAAELADKKWAEAAVFEQRAIAAAEAAGGASAPDLWQPLVGLARADIELGKNAEAKPLLERAIAIAEKIQVAPEDLAPARAALAKLTR